MSLNQKRAWGNLLVWGAYLIVSAVVLGVNGTVFFWQEDSLKTLFYVFTGIAVAAWFVMMAVVWLTAPRSRVGTDERDVAIMSRVNSAAGPIAMTAVAVTALILMIVYLEDRRSVMSPYFLIYLTLVNVVVYWLAQAIGTLASYRHS